MNPGRKRHISQNDVLRHVFQGVNYAPSILPTLV